MGKEDLLDAARNGDIPLVGKILDQITRRSGPLSIFPRSINLNGQDMNGYTALHHACLNGHTNIARLLLAHDAVSDITDIRGSTPLYLAAWAGHQEIVKMLLMHPQRPCDPNAQTIENETPLHSAAQHGHNTVLAILLAYGADPSIRNNSFRTALDLAAEFGRFEAVKMLIRTHPELLNPYRLASEQHTPSECSSPFLNNTPTPTKHIFTHTCLHLSSRNGHKKVVELLLDAGVDPNILTHAGSALHEASLCGKKSVVSILLRAGVDPNATDGNGRTALDILKDYPPHVTYEISSAINEFCRERGVGSEHVFKPITDSDSSSSERGRHGDTKKPKQLYSYGTQLMPKPTKTVVLSNSLGSLETQTSHKASASKSSEYYLPMKPILWPNNSTTTTTTSNATTTLTGNARAELTGGDSGVLAYKPVYKQPYISSFTTPWRNCNKLLQNGEDAKSTSTHSLERPRFVALQQSGVNCEDSLGQDAINRNKCRDEYVQMSEPSKSDDSDVVVLRRSRTSTTAITTPIPSPRCIETADYANINTLTRTTKSENKENSPCSAASEIIHSRHRQKEHSATPEFPPPSVSEAEQTILQFMQPVCMRNSGSSCNNDRRHSSIQIEERNDLNLESLIKDAIDLDVGTDSARSSRVSDCVEEFIGDGAPFAGLFKGSTLNLAGEDKCDGPELRANYQRLRSPSLVRSVVRWPTKEIAKVENNESDNNNNAEAINAEEMNETKVWDEINSILESIGNEMFTDEAPASVKPPAPMAGASANTLNKASTQQPSVQIRKPTELLLTSSNDNETTNWCHSTNTLIYGQVLYDVFYLGSTVIKELHGTVSTRKSIQKLKRGETPFDHDVVVDCSSSTKFLKANNEEARLKVGIALSYIGVRFIDDADKSTICTHTVENINCVCQDAEDLRYFAYITKEREMHYCHVFMVDCVALATEIILTLGQAFEVAYQLALAANTDELAN